MACTLVLLISLNTILVGGSGSISYDYITHIVTKHNNSVTYSLHCLLLFQFTLKNT